MLAGVGFGLWMPRAEPAPLWLPPALPAQRLLPRSQGMPSLAPLIETVAAAVVGIRTVHRAGWQGSQWRKPAENRSRGVSVGTGFIFHEQGLILTAHHLVAQPISIVVELPGHGRNFAELLGEDPITDLAVLRLIEPPDDLKVLRLGYSEQVRQGDWVMTIGNPLRFNKTVGVGIVSHINRHLVQDGMELTNDYLQFTAPTNPGSSGSPVFAMNGAVIGITTRSARSGEGLSFAVPSKVIRRVLMSMEANQGRVRRGFLGLEFQTASRDLTRAYSIADGRAVRVTAVIPGQPAERAGLLEGDLLLSYNNRPVVSGPELHDWITWSAPGAVVELEVIRNGKRIAPVRAILGEVGASVSSEEEAEDTLIR